MGRNIKALAHAPVFEQLHKCYLVNGMDEVSIKWQYSFAHYFSLLKYSFFFVCLQTLWRFICHYRNLRRFQFTTSKVRWRPFKEELMRRRMKSLKLFPAFYDFRLTKYLYRKAMIAVPRVIRPFSDSANKTSTFIRTKQKLVGEKMDGEERAVKAHFFAWARYLLSWLSDYSKRCRNLEFCWRGLYANDCGGAYAKRRSIK